jgi:DNA modification methylase
METTHKIFVGPAQRMSEISDKTVDFTITSPPYPMIEMWDEIMGLQNPEILDALKNKNGNLAFELMHRELDKAWNELYRVTKNGGIVCINIGDATRTMNGDFKLYSNHSRILSHCLKLGFNNFPNILWRKQTNAPNKFMGSGMLPPGAYVTLEHEYILVFRKGNKREFKTESEKINRQNSSFFWEERNIWFSDVWDFKGTTQKINGLNNRERSGAFPFEMAYRMINMFSVKNDTILDPFMGTGTTMLASIAAGRNSIGYEIDSALASHILSIANMDSIKEMNLYIQNRLSKHLSFISERIKRFGKDAIKHNNKHYGFPVVTNQEKEIIINYIESLDKIDDNALKAIYFNKPFLSYSDVGSLFSQPQTVQS